MSARRLLGALLACVALAGAGIAARAAAPRPGAGSTIEGPTLAAVQQAIELQADGAGAAVPTRLAYKNTLPDSAGRVIAERWCQLCHSAMLITQQAKDSTAWEKTLGQMEKWGVTVTPEERDSLRLYLVQNFGPRPVPPARGAAPAPATHDTARAPASPR
jgi:cytochrome c5